MARTGFCLEAVMRLQVTIEAAHRGESPGRRALGEAATLHLAEEAAEPQAIDPGPVPVAAVVAIAEGGERLEVATVGLHRVGRVLAFVGQVAEELLDFRAGRREGGRAGSDHSESFQISKSRWARSTSRVFFSDFSVFLDF